MRQQLACQCPGTDRGDPPGAAHAFEIHCAFGRFDNTFTNKVLFNDDNIPGQNVTTDSYKHIVFDDGRDGGIRMSHSLITMELLRQRLFTDSRSPDKKVKNAHTAPM